MSKQANKTLIGAFVVGAIALVVAGVLIFGSGRFLSEKAPFVLYFDGSVKGLNIGAPVVFRGVEVGSVTDILLVSDQAKMDLSIPVFIEIEPNRVRIKEGQRIRSTEEAMGLLIKRGLRAQLEMQSLVTGQMMVALDFHPDKPERLLGDGKVPEIPTISSPFEELAETIKKAPIEEILSNIESAAVGIESIINSPEAKGMLSSLNKSLEDIRKLVNNLDEQVKPLADTTRETLIEYQGLARNVSSKVEPVTSNVDGALDDARKLMQDLNSNLNKIAAGAEETFNSATKALSSAERLTSEDSVMVQQLSKALKEFATAARSLRVLTEYLERHPEALLRGKSASGGN